ncbi:MAG: glycosyl transferase [Rhodothermaceae bacterium]|nr:glycosyl transferase [Rhodothermaceae bacterium]MBC14404.1 glycosyl transferase [Rhodothermaceae bacterium]
MPASLLWIVDAVVLTYVVLVVGHYLIGTGIALGALVRLRRRLSSFHVEEVAATADIPAITLLVPMYNEGVVAVEATLALLAVEYPAKEVLIIDDGSSDDTVARLDEAFDLVEAVRPPTSAIPHAPVQRIFRSRVQPELWVLSKTNGGGKADAVNAGLAYCRTPLFCMLDGDSLLARDALLRAVRPFLDDARTIVVGGTVGIVNGSRVRHGQVAEVRMPTNWLARFQALEYLRAFVASRTAWDHLNALPIVSGAFGLFRLAPVVALGGLDHTTVGEDMELVLHLHQHFRETGQPYRVAYAPDAISWTECPEDRAVLGRQRDRWHRGLAQILWRHRKMFFNPRYGRVGMLAFPVYVLVELLGPVVEALGYVVLAVLVALGLVNGPVAVLLLALAVALGVAQSIASVALEQLAFRRYTRLRDIALLLGLAVLENIGYRQMTVYWRIRGLVSYFRKTQSWGVMTRTGFQTS